VNTAEPRLLIVATPIGNLNDISFRAVELLHQVDLIAAEDTRHSARLLAHYGIRTPVIACHEHNESTIAEGLIEKMRQGTRIALISDAGTPLVSDPGFELVRKTLAAGISVTSVPGPAALISALSVSGLPVHRFAFEGFLSAKAAGRKKQLQALRREARTLILYEAPHRMQALFNDLVSVLGEDRPAFVAREMTKTFEQFNRGTVGEICAMLTTGHIPLKGEFVVIVGGYEGESELSEWEGLMAQMLDVISPARAAAILSQHTGMPKKLFYDLAVRLKSG